MIFFQLLLLSLLIYIIYVLSYSVIKGAPFAALSNSRINTMIKLLNMDKRKKFCDLGSGDGRIVVAASKTGIDSTGYEINPLIYLISYINLKLQKAGSAKVILSDYWKVDLSEYDYIAVWGAPFMMARLEKKLLKELKPGAKVVSNHYRLPNWKPNKYVNDVYLYIKNT